MSGPFQDYFKLLRDVGALLEQLAALAQQKAAAVRQDDLLALDQVLNQEQALSLSLRGTEQKRSKLLRELKLEQVPLSELYQHCPEHLRGRTKQTAERLRTSYDLYRNAAGAARSALEVGLHELDKIVTAMGGAPAESAGYRPADVQPPPNMKTDFRA